MANDNDSSWQIEYLWDVAVARVVRLLAPPELTPQSGPADPSEPAEPSEMQLALPEGNQLMKVFRENTTVENCMLLAAGLVFGDVYLGFWLTQQPILSLPSIMFYGSAGLAFISWESVVTTDPGGIPESFGRDVHGRPRFEADINEGALVQSRRRLKFIKNKEQKFKPRRSHYCSQQDRYILRMDHYCAFTSNGIGYMNHKYFYLFLLYSSMATSVETFAVMARIWQSTPVAQVLLLPGAALNGFLASLLVSYLGFHTYLLCNNLTMVEHTYPPKRRPEYDLGLQQNVAQVLGNCWLYWLSPFSGPDGTGVEWGIEEEDVPESHPEFLQTSLSLSVRHEA